MTRSTRLALLLGASLDEAGPAPLEPATLDRVLTWCRKTGTGEDGPADLQSAPADFDRLTALLGRGALLDRMLADWARSGVWVIGRDDPDYPKRLKRRLRGAAPALLFGSGDKSILNHGGVAVVAGAAMSSLAVDRLLDALNQEALTTIVLGQTMPAGSQKTITVNRDGSITPEPGGHGVLIGLVEPGRPGNDTLGAERCLYALSDTAVLLGVSRGDPAWAGAIEAIERGMLPVWVRGEETDAATLIRAGARMLPSGPIVPRDLLRPEPSMQARRATASTAPELEMPKPSIATGFAEAQAGFGQNVRPPQPGSHLRLVGSPAPRAAAETAQDVGSQTLFELFSTRVSRLLSHGPLGAGRIAEIMDLTRLQTEAWLTRAEANGTVRRDPETATYAKGAEL